MKRFLAPLFATLVVLASASAAPVYAQNAAAPIVLPTAPGAHKAVDGGASQAPASLPGPGQSPLEPYLVTWLLPIAGLFCAIVFFAVDKRLRSTHRRRV